MTRLTDAQISQMERACAEFHPMCPPFYSALADLVQAEIARRAGNGDPGGSVIAVDTSESLAAQLRQAFILRHNFEMTAGMVEAVDFLSEVIEQLIALAIRARDAEALQVVQKAVAVKLEAMRAPRH